MIRLEVIAGDQKGKSYVFEEDTITIGRGEGTTLTLSDYHLSGHHGQIFREQDRYVYRDLRSTNGTIVERGKQRFALEGKELELSLRNGDRILLGDPASPVVLGCTLEVREEGHHKVLATRPLQDLSQILGRVEEGPAVSELYQIVKTIAGQLDLDAVLRAVSDAVFKLLPHSTHVAILLSDDNDSERYVPVSAKSRKDEAIQDFLMSRSVLGRVLQDRAAILVADAAAELGSSESIMGANIRSTMAVPLWRGSDIHGVIQCDNRAASGIFTPDDLDLLLVLASQASLAIDNARLHRKLELAKETLQGENLYLKRREKRVSFDEIIGESAPMKAVFEQLRKVLDTRATVCITGETGTGKELIAQAIHSGSRRKQKMFVAQNCAAMPEQLLESELFGHHKGAFTGADKDKKGLFVIADGGTLFLDEIGEMHLTLQAKLLRVLQEGEVRAVGSTEAHKVDVRIVCATNRDLTKEVEAGRFRQDLFYRLMVFPIALPPLRERREDIPALAQHFIERYTSEMRKPLAGISQEALNYLQSYNWPGNIRELENEVQRLIIQADEGAFIEAEHISQQIRQVDAAVARMVPKKGTLKEMMEQVERWLLSQALEDHGGNKTRTAETLGITREGLHKKLSKYGM